MKISMGRALAWLAVWLLLCNTLSAQTVVNMEALGERSLMEMQQRFGLFGQNAVTQYKLLYTTTDVFGQPDTASGLLVVPLRPQAYVYPLYVFQHGTVDGPADVPSNFRGGWELALIAGGLGYVAIAPDYLGLGEARGFHPYVHASSEASAALDMIRALRAYAPEAGIRLNDQLFITGYSQGGHASMALHRAIEREHSEEFSVTAAAHLSGPYSISGIMRELILGNEPYNYPAYVPNTFLSYNYVYQIYGDNIDWVFKEKYVPYIRDYYEGTIDLDVLNDTLLVMLSDEFGASIARELLQDSIVQALRTQPDHPINRALRDNDVYEWAPQAPTRLFYCRADEQVPFRNSVVADSVMTTLGAAKFDAVEVSATANHYGCVFPAMTSTLLFFGQFQSITVPTRETDARPEWKIYPNPAVDRLYFQGLTGPTDIALYDVAGRLQIQLRLATGAGTELDVSDLAPGLYVVRLTDGRGSVVRQVVVQ